MINYAKLLASFVFKGRCSCRRMVCLLDAVDRDALGEPLPLSLLVLLVLLLIGVNGFLLHRNTQC